MLFQWQPGDLLIHNDKIIGFLNIVLQNENLIIFHRFERPINPFDSERLREVSSSTTSTDETGDNSKNRKRQKKQLRLGWKY